MTRFDVFEVYLESDREKMAALTPRQTVREMQFQAWMDGGASWDECERRWAAQQPATPRKRTLGITTVARPRTTAQPRPPAQRPKRK